MNVVIWIIQGVLALVFIVFGEMKATQHITRLALKLQWVTDFEPEVIRVLGISELLCGFGLILPMATDIHPRITPISAAILALLMVLAAIYNFRKGKYRAIRLNLLLFTLCTAVAFYRF